MLRATVVFDGRVSSNVIGIGGVLTCNILLVLLLTVSTQICRMACRIAYRFTAAVARKRLLSSVCRSVNPETIRVAIVGTGPSGFYAGKYLLEKDPRIQIDFIERLPTPYG